MLFILTVHSYSFLPYLYNLSHRLMELNVSLLYLIKLIFFIYLMKATTCECKRIQLNFIRRVCLQNFLIKQDNFYNTWHKTKSRNFSMLYNLLPESIDKVI